MLKNKKITYLLIVLAVLIWGLIFYKIYSKFGGEKLTEKNFLPSVVSVESGQRDSIFTLSLDYADPFLKGAGQSTDTPVKNVSNPRIVSWPLVEFRGLLSSGSKNERTGLIKIQNSNLLAKLGKVYSEIKVRTITRDSIFLEYQNENRWFRIMK